MVIVSDANAGNNSEPNAREKTMVPIFAFTASGNITELKTALNDGLDAGLTINQGVKVIRSGFEKGLATWLEPVADEAYNKLK